MKLPATMKMSATAKLSSNYTLSPGWHTPHISYPQTSFFFLLHSLLWSMTRHHNSIWPDQVCRKGSHCQNTGSCRRHDGSVGWGEKSAVCNRMSGLSCLITGATWDWMQRLHPCANSVCVCYFCRKMQRSLRKRLIQYSPLFSPHPSVPPAFSCDAGEFLEMSAQECTQCAAGSYSLGSGVRFDQWDSMPAGFSSLATSLENSPRGDDRLTCNRCESWIAKNTKTINPESWILSVKINLASFSLQFVLGASRKLPGVQQGRVHGLSHLRRPPEEAGLRQLWVPVSRQEPAVRVLREFH